jgi:hypothetical protein
VGDIALHPDRSFANKKQRGETTRREKKGKSRYDAEPNQTGYMKA